MAKQSDSICRKINQNLLTNLGFSVLRLQRPTKRATTLLQLMLLFFCINLPTSAGAGCDGLYGEYRVEEFEKLAEYEFSGRVSLPLTTSMATQIYIDAVVAFEKAYEPVWLEENLNAIKDTGVVKKDSLVRLKAIRKAAAMLRSSFESFNQGHKIPKSLQEFTKIFGGLNDALEAKTKSAAIARAKELLNVLDSNKLHKDIKDFTPLKSTKTEKFFLGLLEDILETADHKVITVEEFHEMRKSLKQFLNIYLLLPQTREAIEAGTYLTTLNEELGNIHDLIVKEDLKGKLDYDKVKIRLRRSLRLSIKNFLEHIDIQSF